MEALEQLIVALRRLPTIGPKTARRLALHLLQRDRAAGAELARSLSTALDTLQPCRQCRQLSATELCGICADDERDQQIVCVVESLDELYQIEQTGVFNGRYFVLNGHLSPLDGIGPEELGIPQLLEQVRGGGIRELIMALSTQVEGEATAQYIADQIGPEVSLSTLAQGVPMGRSLNHLDPATLSVALSSRVARQTDAE
ncbi:recombination protein RecR [Natronospirillum operosum]|uniref:Recombination protein RecR n=1 Tax=Natronospirillum operosum TaxID=2759953 RepID=A0A4Z0WK23_9GAMM|nr:recombination mediator RecR [Natronospirillum operosum]TGG95545.1 recombination protein RecR [Natronospirillum operosum]